MAISKMHSESESRKPLTAERLRGLLHYDPETGAFIWRVGRSNVAKGSMAGCVNREGYRQVRIDGVSYRGNRLAWLYMTGAWPAMMVDHKDADPSNDRFANLREATHSQNKQNSRTHRNNTSGFKGVTFNKASNCWQAGIKHAGRSRHLGLFDTAAEAHAAYCTAAVEIDPDFARFA